MSARSTSERYDAVIVGARCAGAATAMLLARQGYRVLLLERAAFPSDTLSGHYIQQAGIGRLQRWGLLERLAATGCPPVRQMTFDVGLFALTGRAPSAGDDLPDYCPRRSVIDPLLAEAAVEAGAELRTGFSVQELVSDGERITGIRGRAGGGATATEHARIVVGADGRHSFVAQATGAPFMQFHEPISSGYYTYYAGLDCDSVETFFYEGLFCVMFPTNDGLTTVAVEWPRERFAHIRRDPEEAFLSALDRVGAGPRVRNAERVEPFVGAATLPNYIRAASGPGWALVGDALCHKDPAAADGISDAFRGAELLAEAINTVLSEGSDDEPALEHYEQAHAEVAGPLLDAAVRVARFDISPKERFDAFIEIRLHDHEEMTKIGEGTPSAF